MKILLMRDEGGIFMDVDVEMIHSFGWLFAKLPDNLQFFAGLNFPKPGTHVGGGPACCRAGGVAAVVLLSRGRSIS